MIQLRKPQGPFLSTSPDSTPTISPEGMLLYAIGDIHGRNDLLLQLVDMIRADVAQQCSPRRPTLVFLGDYVDRGPASHKVIDTLIALRSDPGFEMIALRGNHDQFLLDFLETGARGPLWMTFGGAPTLLAYGVTPPRRSDEPSWAEASKSLAAAMPPAHLSFLNSLPYCAVAGEYVFVAYTRGLKADGLKYAFVKVFTLATGAAVGNLVAEKELGEIGLLDIVQSVRAVRRSNGEYVVFLEDDDKAKVVMFRWQP